MTHGLRNGGKSCSSTLAFLLAGLVTLVVSPKTFAANGTWTQAASGGLWSDTANWSGGIVADGSGSSADFSTIDITADNTVHMDAAHTLTSLIFGDTDTNTAAGWTVDNNGTAGNILTLAGTTPSITVGALGTGKAATISAVLAGSTAWSKLGAGTLTLSGANTFTGNWAVNAGTLNYNGSLTGGTQLTVNGSGANSIVNIGSGASIAFNNASILDGDNATAGTAGAVFQSGGTVTGVNQLQLGVVTGGSYGYYNLSGSAALTIAELDCGGFNGAPTGVFDIAGGTFTDTSWLIIARGSGGPSLLNLTGGTVNFTGTSAGRLLMNFNANASQSAVINVANANFNALNASAGILNMMRSASSGEFAAVNLLSGGVMQVQGITGGNTTGTSHFNFNGGTLKASTANATFMDNNISLANVYSGGGTIDNNGVTVAIAKALTAPAGNGLNGSVTLNSGGSGYIGAPAVTFSGGGGTGATAYATVSGGAVTGVVITSPGVNYSSTPTIVFTGGGGTGVSATAPAPTANTSGGMTFQGSGTTILNGANTYGGDTTINSGTTVLTKANTYGGNTIINGGTLKLGSALLHLSFDDVSGSTVINDGSGGSAMNGTLNGTATIVSGGKFGNCLQISGANSAAASCRVANAVVPLNVGAGNTWTVAMWVKSSTAGGCYAYQGDGGWASGNTTFYMNSGSTTGTKAGGVRNGQGWEAGTAAVNDGAWHHVVLTCNGTTKTAYVDGNVDSLSPNSWSGNGTGGQFWIGGAGDTGDGTANLNGDIDEVYVYNRALSQTEIQSLYNNNTDPASETILPPNTTVTVASGATLDVSATTFTLPANLMGSGVVTGAVTTASTSGIFAGTDGTAGTLSFSNDLAMTSGSTFNMDVSTSASTGNDEIIVGGPLTLNTTTFSIRALSGAANLDQSADYVLVSAASISGTLNSAVSWVGTQPANAANYSIVKSGNTIVLHYSTAASPTITSATANPSTLARGASTFVTAAVTSGGGAITSVTVSGAALSSTVTLVSDGAGNYTNNAVIAANTAAGNQTLTVSVTDANLLSAYSNITVTVLAQDDVWNGGGSDNKWTTGGNWTSGIQPASGGDSVFFAGTTQTTANMDSNFSVAALTFNSGAGSFTITNPANTLTLTGGVTNNSANAQIIDVPVALSSSQAINAASGNITISRAVSDSGAGLTKAGTGTLTLSGVNTYSGATTIGNGVLAISGAGQLGGGTYLGNIMDNGALNVGSSASQTLSGIISGTGSLTNSGSGTLTLNGANNYSGGTTISAGTIVFGNNTAFGSGTITADGGTLRGTATTANNMVVNSATTFDVAGGNWYLNGNISGSGAINRGTAATLSLYLGGDNSGYTGIFTVPNNGSAVVRFNSVSAGSAGASWVFNDTTAGRTTLSFSGAGMISFGSMTGGGEIRTDVAGAKTISVGALGLNDTFSGTIINGTGTIALTKVGSGTMTLSGANTYTGGTSVSNGTLVVNGSIGAGAVTVTNATLGGVGTIAGATTLQPNSILVPGTNDIGTLTFSSSLTLDTISTNNFVVTVNGASNKVAVAGLLTPNSSVVKITSGTALPVGTNTLFTYGSISGSFASTPVFDIAPVHTASIVDDGAGHINLVVPNNAPVAAVYNATRNSGINTLKIALSDLATNWSDADGDTITFVSANASTNGVTISTNGGYILYTNTNNVNDQFTYTIADSFGATATGIVNITVTSGSGSQNIASEQINGNGTVTLNMAGIPGYTYRTQASTNLTDWVDISTNTAGSNGLWQVNDSDATNFPNRYYRTVYP